MCVSAALVSAVFRCQHRQSFVFHRRVTMIEMSRLDMPFSGAGARQNIARLLMTPQRKMHFQPGYYFDDTIGTPLKSKPTRLIDAIKLPLAQHPCGLLLFEMHTLGAQTSSKVVRLDQARLNKQEAIVVDCLYFNPLTDIYTLVDRRVLVSLENNKTADKLVEEMLLAITNASTLSFSTVLMDTWYATREIMLLAERLGKGYWSKIESSRLVCRHGDGEGEIKRQLMAHELVFDAENLVHGKILRLSSFPFEHRVRLFLIGASPYEKNYIVTDQLSQNQSGAAAVMYDVLNRRRR
jgi:hypothetical protein